jgi:DNA-binding transcriptional LysR family regulator
MELYLLRTFVTVAEQGHLTKAATLLHVTQPAVSGQIKALEEQLKLKLFDRGPSGVRLTKAGEALLPHAKAVVSEAAEFRKAANRLEGHLTGMVRLGTIVDPHIIRLGPLVSTLLERHPWLDLRLQHGISTWATECVSNGALDAAFSLGGAFHANVRVVPLAEIAYRIVAPPGWASGSARRSRQIAAALGAPAAPLAAPADAGLRALRVPATGGGRSSLRSPPGEGGHRSALCDDLTGRPPQVRFISGRAAPPPPSFRSSTRGRGNDTVIARSWNLWKRFGNRRRQVRIPAAGPWSHSSLPGTEASRSAVRRC